MRFNLLETFMNHGLETSNRPSHPNPLWIKRNLDWYQDSEIGQPPAGCNVPVNPFVPNVPFLHPLQTSENRKIFWCFQGVEKGCIRKKWVNQIIVNTAWNVLKHRLSLIRIFSYMENIWYFPVYDSVLIREKTDQRKLVFQIITRNLI